MLVLVVEDGAAVRRMLTDYCSVNGHEAVATGSIEEVRALPGDYIPEAAIIDVLLPDGSGLSLIEPLLEGNSDMRIVITTGYPFAGGATYAMQLGACDYLAKPLSTMELDRALAGRQRTLEDLGPAPTSLARAEWEYINEVFVSCGGNVSEAARRLGIYRQSLQRKLRRGPPKE